MHEIIGEIPYRRSNLILPKFNVFEKIVSGFQDINYATNFLEIYINMFMFYSIQWARFTFGNSFKIPLLRSGRCLIAPALIFWTLFVLAFVFYLHIIAINEAYDLIFTGHAF